ncbi:MAG: cyclic nucleotide-binding domain-containing protein [Anaerolineales bacterium]|nr:cyclic nucleotide-binding domain-containing protein [Anaerolineales bacterium]
MSLETSPLQTLLTAFPGIPEAEAQELINSGEVHTYPKDTVLCQEDTYEATFYILLEGMVKVTKVISHDEVRLLKTLLAGDFFGEMALIHNAPRAASVTTTTQTTVLEIRKHNFNQLLRHSASLSLAMVQEVSRRLRENDAMAIEDLRLKAGELAAAYQQLAEQEFARRSFLTTISHELRTPLTTASGFLQLIENSLAQGHSLDLQTQQAALKSASRNLQEIVALVNDILFVQEMDLILPSFEPTNLKEVLLAVVEKYAARVHENEVELLVQIPDLPSTPGDARSLQRAFGAILDNAVKFSYPGGKVEVLAGEESGQVWVEVRDYGVGIPADILPRIFDRFFHIDQIEGRLYRGAGLGLSIARQVIEQHHGKIEVQSELGSGTRVKVTLDREN